MRTTPSIAAVVIAIAAAVHVAAQAPRPDPLVRENTTQKVTDHVYVIPDNNVGMVPNVGIIVGDRAVLVVDTGMGARNGATVLKEAQKIAGNKAMFLATTHVH